MLKLPLVFKLLLLTFLILFLIFFVSLLPSNQLSLKESTIKLLPINPHSKKIYLIVVDALRRDFFEEMPQLNEVLISNKSNTFFALNIVGVPTVTSARIQSMMTGVQRYDPLSSLKNFLTETTLYDNILSQLTRQRKKYVVFGDELWTQKFQIPPELYLGGCMSFNIYDDQTCDTGSQKKLSQFVKKKQYDLVVAHLTQLDHYGHLQQDRNHPSLKKAVARISKVVHDLMQSLGDDEIIFVTGDHGMTDHGAHSGGSKTQIQSFLFAYSKNPFIRSSDYTSELNFNEIRQIDLTSTLSILLDIPVPTNSLGYPILSILDNRLEEQHIKIINSNVAKHFMEISQAQGLTCSLKQQKQPSIQQVYRFGRECLLYNLLFPWKSQWSLYLSGSLIFLLLIILGKLLKPIPIEIFINVILVVLPFIFINAIKYQGYIGIIVPITLFTIFIDKNIKINSKIYTIICFFFFGLLYEIPKFTDYQPLKNILKYPIPLISLAMIVVVYFRKYKSNKLRLLSLIILILIFIQHILSYINLDIVDYFRILTSLTIFGRLIVLWRRKGTQQEEKQAFAQIIFCVECFFCMMLQNKGPIIVFLFRWLYKRLQSSSCIGYLYFLLAQIQWVLLGNNYQLNTIDITKSYLFSKNYRFITNSVCLFLYYFLPYFIALLRIQYVEFYKRKTSHQEESMIFVQQQLVTGKFQKKEDTSLDFPKKLSQQKIQLNVSQPNNSIKIMGIAKVSFIFMTFVFSQAVYLSFLDLRISAEANKVEVILITILKTFVFAIWVLVRLK